MTSIQKKIEKNLKKVCNSLPDLILIVDKEGEIVYTNRRIKDLFGYTRSEIIGEKVEKLVPDNLEKKHIKERIKYQKNPTQRPMGSGIDLKAKRKDNSTFPVDIALSPINLETTYFLAAVRDLTTHEIIEKKYQTLLETTPDPIFIADTKTGKIIDVNNAGVEILGYDKNEIIGMNQRELHPTDENEQYEKIFEKHIKYESATFSRLPDGSNIYLETKNDEKIPVEINAQIVNLKDRQIIIGIFRDISKRVEYESELKEKINRLEEFSNIVSHDLRNPLNIVKTHIEFLENKYSQDKDIRKIRHATERTEEIINNLLMLVKENSISEIEKIDIQKIAKECWKNIITENAELQAENIEIMADREKLKNLFENFFRNSIEHGGDNIDIYIGELENGFYIEDDGPGISEEKRENVFKKGYSTSREGTGLGLSIVKKIVDSHGWDINIEDGKTLDGVRFEIYTNL